MDEISPLLTELRAVNAESREISELEDKLRERKEKVRDRSSLLNDTWRILCSNEGMTLIQAKMIAHERASNGKRKMSFMWTEDRLPENENWWQRILRNLYIGLGGKG